MLIDQQRPQPCLAISYYTDPDNVKMNFKVLVSMKALQDLLQLKGQLTFKPADLYLMFNTAEERLIRPTYTQLSLSCFYVLLKYS